MRIAKQKRPHFPKNFPTLQFISLLGVFYCMEFADFCRVDFLRYQIFFIFLLEKPFSDTADRCGFPGGWFFFNSRKTQYTTYTMLFLLDINTDYSSKIKDIKWNLRAKRIKLQIKAASFKTFRGIT